MALNFAKRYKWIPFNEAGSLLLPLPSFSQFSWDLKSLFEVSGEPQNFSRFLYNSITQDETFVPLKHLQLAQSILLDLTQWDTHIEYGQEESIGQVNVSVSITYCVRHLQFTTIKFLNRLASVAGQLATELRHANVSTPFVWDPAYHPWFPRCLS